MKMKTVQHECAYFALRDCPSPPVPGTPVVFPHGHTPLPEGPFPMQGLYHIANGEIIDSSLMVLSTHEIHKRAYLQAARNAIPSDEVIYCIWNDVAALHNRFLWHIEGPPGTAILLSAERADGKDTQADDLSFSFLPWIRGMI